MSAEKRRISPLRLLGVLGACGAVGAGVTVFGMRTVEATFTTPAKVWYAPYVDVSLTPIFNFEDPQVNPAADVVLSFVVADPQDACAPNWGTYYNLDAAGRALDLDRRIARLRERGGDVTVSFGGLLNQELAVSCTDEDALVAAYQSVVDRYDAQVLDFDIEGTALSDVAANQRRAAALARLQEANEGLQVWLTVPVAPTGMTAEGVALVDATLAAGVDLTGVNVMTMNYGGSRVAGQSMADANEAALNATFQQLNGSLQQAGLVRTGAEVWSMIGATPMIGQNDVAADRLTLDDADALIRFAGERSMGRLSMWSANRDRPCGVQGDAGQVSNSCSGVEQEDAGFGLRFNDAAKVERTSRTAPAAEQGGDRATASRDDPATSPYPIWRSTKVYEEGDKVVWQRNVYQAKWFAQGTLPDAPVANLWDTPWRYLGPVLESDGVVASTIPVGPLSGEFPKWTADKVFVAGDQVQLFGQVYKARWWTQGTEPQLDPDSPYDNPWEWVGEAVPTTP